MVSFLIHTYSPKQSIRFLINHFLFLGSEGDSAVEDISGGIYDILMAIGSLKCSLAEEVASDIEDYVLANLYEVVEE